MAYANVACRIGVFVSIGLMAVIFLFSRQIALLFTRDEEIIRSVTLSLYVVVLALKPQNGRVILAGVLRGAGDAKFVAACALTSVTILRPALTYLFCYPAAALLPALPVAVMAPWVAFLIDAFVREFLLGRRMKRGKWLEIHLQ